MLKNSTNAKQGSKGFTIIEVLIVLAIAGLILLIVFLAVPALQRNSRNTQRKNDVAAVLGAVNEWSNNNGGQLPETADEQLAASKNAKLGIYKGAVTFSDDPGTNNTVENVVVVTGAKCVASGNTAAGSKRQIAAMYKVETGGDPQAVCQDS